MGKVPSTAAATATMKGRKKKKGRPSLSDLQKREPSKKKTLTKLSDGNYNSSSVVGRRSGRRNNSNYYSDSNNNNSNDSTDFIDDDDDDDDDEREEKKVKLVVRLPQSNQHHQQQQHSQDSGSENSGSDSDSDLKSSLKKRKIDVVRSRSDDAGSDQGEKVQKATDTLNGSPLETGPTTPLPDKKLLVFILDRLQKKDTYGVFSEPVDPNELPDYHEIIEHPMDFGTVRKKLDGKVYKNLEELEADVFLICSNAMQYNASDTVYFRQARSIQELAKRDFENLRHEGDDGEPQPKVVRRGRPPSKNLKKSMESSPVDRVDPELSSGATLASGEDKATGSGSYNLRKGPMLSRFRSSDTFVTPFRSRNGENYSEWLADWNEEFPASILKADMKYGKKHFSVDENRRDTYKQCHPVVNEPSLLLNMDGNMKRLSAVGLHFEQHAYAKSLARFAANLGPVAWKFASKKIESVLPPGLKYGPGWVGENEAPRQASPFSPEKQKSSSSFASDHILSRPMTPSTSTSSSAVASRSSEEMVEAIKRLNSQNDLTGQATCFPWAVSGSSQGQQKPLFQHNRNGFNGMFGYDVSSQMGKARECVPRGQLGPEQGTAPNQILRVASRGETSSPVPAYSNHVSSVESTVSESLNMLQSGNPVTQGRVSNPDLQPEAGLSCKSPWQQLSMQHRQRSIPVPPDLNVRIQAPGSPGSSIPIGSPQQPDLALQL